MSRLGKLVFQRVIVVAFFILLQLGALLSTVIWLSEYRRWIQVFMTALSVLTIVYLLYDRTNSSYKIAWIILILAFPVAGISLYLTFGGRRPQRPDPPGHAPGRGYGPGKSLAGTADFGQSRQSQRPGLGSGLLSL